MTVLRKMKDIYSKAKAQRIALHIRLPVCEGKIGYRIKIWPQEYGTVHKLTAGK